MDPTGCTFISAATSQEGRKPPNGPREPFELGSNVVKVSPGVRQVDACTAWRSVGSKRIEDVAKKGSDVCLCLKRIVNPWTGGCELVCSQLHVWDDTGY